MKNQESREEVILGVVIDTIGRVLGTLSVGTHDAGYQQLLCWAQAFGVLRRAGVEGTGSYGAAAEKVMLLTLRAPQDQFWREMPILFPRRTTLWPKGCERSALCAAVQSRPRLKASIKSALCW